MSLTWDDYDRLFPNEVADGAPLTTPAERLAALFDEAFNLGVANRDWTSRPRGVEEIKEEARKLLSP